MIITNKVVKLVAVAVHINIHQVRSIVIVIKTISLYLRSICCATLSYILKILDAVYDNLKYSCYLNLILHATKDIELHFQYAYLPTYNYLWRINKMSIISVEVAMLLP